MRKALQRVYARLNEVIWAPDASPALRERRTKIVMVSGVGVFAVALMILFLFVLPAMQIGGTPSEAQPGPAPGGAPPMPGGAPPMPGGAPPMPGGVEMPGGPGMPGAPGGAPGAVGVPSGPAQPPLEVARQNPFAAPGAAELPGAAKEFKTTATKYGPDWSRLPITLREGFVPPERPPHPAPAPSSEEIRQIEEGAGAGFRISSILWTQGSPLATYETTDGKTGTVGPGDVVQVQGQSWKILEIGRDYVLVQNVRNPAATQRVPLRRGR